MFTLSQEMLDIVNYRKESNLLFDVGVADALSKRLVSSVLNAAVVEGEPIHLRCFESTHEMLLEQLSQHKTGYDHFRLSDRFYAAGRPVLRENWRMWREFLVYKSTTGKTVPGLSGRTAAFDSWATFNVRAQIA